MITEARTEFVISKALLHSLAAFRSPSKNALSFYVCPEVPSDNASREERIEIKDLIRDVIASSEQDRLPESFHDDLRKMRQSAETAGKHPERFHAIFACAEQSVWKEFDFHVSVPLLCLRRSQTFTLRPLIQVLGELELYLVILLESGKARIFSVQGTAIEELPLLIPDHNFESCLDDSRVGWSSHIEGHRHVEEMKYFRRLKDELYGLIVNRRSNKIAIGCREDLWGEIKGEFSELEEHVDVIRFHLPAFSMTAHQVLVAVRQAGALSRARLHSALIAQIESLQQQVAIGVRDVRRSLEEGRARILLLSSWPDGKAAMQVGHGAGPDVPFLSYDGFSESSNAFAADPTEDLIRLALAKDVEILMLHDLPTKFQGAATLFRY